MWSRIWFWLSSDLDIAEPKKSISCPTKMKSLPPSPCINVAHVAIGMSFIASYSLLNGYTLHECPIHSKTDQLEPAQEVSAMVSISFQDKWPATVSLFLCIVLTRPILLASTCTTFVWRHSLLYAPAPKDAPFLDPHDLLSESVVVCSSLTSSLTVLLLLESVMALSSSAVPAPPTLCSW